MKKPKTDKLLKGVVASGFAITSLAACSTNSREELVYIPNNVEVTEAPDLPSPEETDCYTWQWDEEAQVYQCVEESSENYGHYYSRGSWFPTVAAFMAGQALGKSSSNSTRSTPPPSTNATRQQGTTTNSTNVAPSTSSAPKPSGQITNSRSGMGSGGTFGG